MHNNPLNALNSISHPSPPNKQPVLALPGGAVHSRPRRGGTLKSYPPKLGPHFSRHGVAPAPTVPPGYAYARVKC